MSHSDIVIEAPFLCLAPLGTRIVGDFDTESIIVRPNNIIQVTYPKP
jgi:hypothetical protein